MKDKVWLSSPHMGDKEFEYVKDAFETNWIAPLGPHVNEVEAMMTSYVGKPAAALNTGTAAIHLALIQLGVSKGDKVICSSFTFAASCNPIVYVGAEPIFVDSERDTWNICPKTLEECIKDQMGKGTKPKAIILVHLYGMPAKMDQIMGLSLKYNIPIIEDAAEALGSEYKGEKAGSFGDYSAVSFNGNKIITGSCGGVLLTKTQKMADKARFLSTQAKDDAPHFEHSEIGYNYRMSNVCAAIVRGQLEVLDKRVKRRREINAIYKHALDKVEGISFLKEPSEDFYSNYWLTCVLIDEGVCGVSREELRLFLMENNVESRPLWKPMHLQPIYAKNLFYSNSVSSKLFDTGLCLPSGSNMSNEILNEVIDLIKSKIK